MASLLLIKSMLLVNAMQKSKKKKKLNHKKIKIKSNIDTSMCRICNCQKGDIPIFNNFVQPTIPADIEHFSGISIDKSDKLPQHMCQSCLDLLNGCIMFRDMCQKSNKSMVELLIKRESNSTEINDKLLLDINECEIDNKSDVVKIQQKGVNSDEESYNLPSPTFSDNLEFFKCPSCNKDFSDTKSYNIHLKACNKQEKKDKIPNWKMQSFLCDICGKIAKSKASLLIHMAIHENVFPYKCEECPYQGRTMDLLRIHKRSHLTDKPFKCTQCPKATTTASNLAKHMRHVHSKTRPFKCTYCDKGFSYQHDLKRHVRDIHLRQGTAECDICFKNFNTKKILQGHRLKVHKIKSERQGRLPSYLQCLKESEGNGHHSNNCDSDLDY